MRFLQIVNDDDDDNNNNNDNNNIIIKHLVNRQMVQYRLSLLKRSELKKSFSNTKF